MNRLLTLVVFRHKWAIPENHRSGWGSYGRPRLLERPRHEPPCYSHLRWPKLGRAALVVVLASLVSAFAYDATSLVTTMRDAARQKDHKATSRSLDLARDLLSQNAAVDAEDAQGRTALHWAVIGAMNARKGQHRQAYAELVMLLLARGADVNAEDDCGNTPLDWQEVSPHDDLLGLLLDHGAHNGASNDEAERLRSLISTLSDAAGVGDLGKIRAELAFDLPVGTALSIRLKQRVGSRISQSGNPVEAVVTAPVRANGRVVVGPGTAIHGTVLLAQKADNDYRRAQLTLHFANLVPAHGTPTRLAARVAEVDNARETTEAGRIIGLAHPNHAKLTWGMRLLGMADPMLSYALEAAVSVHDKEYKREILYEPGTDMTLTLLAPAKLAADVLAPAWPVLPASDTLAALVRAQPLRTATPDRIPSDLTNVLLVGTRERIAATFQAAGWVEAGPLGLLSGLKTFAAVAERRGYRSGPVSTLLLDGQRPDLTFQKQNNTFAKRHHVRIWKRPQRHEGQEVWLAAATHDIGIAVHRDSTQWTHRIDPPIDRERAEVANDLLFTGLVNSYVLLDRPDAPRSSENATGDRLETDGRMVVLVLREGPSQARVERTMQRVEGSADLTG